MTFLAAIGPDRGGVINGEVPCRESSRVVGDGEESRVEACCVIAVQFHTRACECGLRNSVILLVEFKHNGIARQRLHVGRVKGKNTRSTDFDRDNVTLQRSGRGRGRVGI